MTKIDSIKNIGVEVPLKDDHNLKISEHSIEAIQHDSRGVSIISAGGQESHKLIETTAARETNESKS